MATLSEIQRQYIIVNKSRQLQGEVDVYFTGTSPTGNVLLGERRRAKIYWTYGDAFSEIQTTIDPNGLGAGLATEYDVEQLQPK